MKERERVDAPGKRMLSNSTLLKAFIGKVLSDEKTMKQELKKKNNLIKGRRNHFAVSHAA